MQDKANSIYFREVGTKELLSAADERELSLRIESLEIDAWQALLSHPPSAGYVAELIERAMESLGPFRRLRRLATAARRSRRAKAAAALRLEARRAARRIRERDRDRRGLELVLVELERIESGAGMGERVLAGPLPFSRKSSGFKRSLSAARDALREAEAARHAFVEANLRLVFHVARPFLGAGIPMTDLVQEGNLGLMKAVDRFDPRRGTRFSTYATWWIRHFIGRAVADKSRAVRVPVYLLEAKQKLASTRRRLSGLLGREPTDNELAEATGYTISRIEAARQHGTSAEISLDATYDDEADARQRAEVFRDPHSEERSPLDDVIDHAAAEELRSLVEELPPREADVLRRRFGLVGDKEQTLQEIADEYHVTRERIRQIQLRALDRLRRRLEEREERRPAA